MKEEFGWFFLNKGNLYGPYITEEGAVASFKRKKNIQPTAGHRPVLGTVYTEGKENQDLNILKGLTNEKRSLRLRFV